MLHGLVLYIPDHQSHGEEPRPMGRAATLCDTHELRIIGWIRAVAPTVSDNFVLTGLDVAFQRALQLQEPRAFLALSKGAEVTFYRLKPFYLHSVETGAGSEADKDLAIVDDAFELADDVGYTGRGKHGMWKLVVDGDFWDPLDMDKRLEATLDANRIAEKKRQAFLEEAETLVKRFKQSVPQGGTLMYRKVLRCVEEAVREVSGLLPV